MPNNENIRSGLNFLGILNDLKRRPEDAATELNLNISEIQDIIDGKKAITSQIVEKATDVWPINARDFYLMHDDCPDGIKIMTSINSKNSSRIMNRAGSPYYEYRDTVMSSIGPFRPEWIEELCVVEDNDPQNSSVQWNNGHFMHQFTYFIGDVNFYYKDSNGKKHVAVMNTGDSMYITPFTPHTFTTRKGSKKNGLILALTYGNNIAGDPQQELSALGTDIGSQFVLNFSESKFAYSSLLTYHMNNYSVDVDGLSQKSKISVDKIQKIIDGNAIPSNLELQSIAKSLQVNIRDLLPSDIIPEKVIVNYHNDSDSRYFPSDSKKYSIYDLASSLALPYSKALEFSILSEKHEVFDLQVGLHQYGYNVGDTPITLNWQYNSNTFIKILEPGDSFYVKPFIPHSFTGNGKLLVLRLGGNVAGDSQRELSFIGKENVTRAISENIQWFDPSGKN